MVDETAARERSRLNFILGSDVDEERIGVLGSLQHVVFGGKAKIGLSLFVRWESAHGRSFGELVYAD